MKNSKKSDVSSLTIFVTVAALSIFGSGALSISQPKRPVRLTAMYRRLPSFILEQGRRRRSYQSSSLTPLQLGVLSFSSSSPTATASSSSDTPDYDVIVIGGGHAGCEAATSSARTGAKTALITQRIDTMGELSCNPSMGGIGKGHLVREVDALGGVMGEVADGAGIHFRMLNRRKGLAVRGPRGQMDRDLYKGGMQEVILGYGENLEIVEGSVKDLMVDEKEGIETLTPMEEEETTIKTTLLGARTEARGGSSDKSEPEARIAELSSSKALTQERLGRIRGVIISTEKEDNLEVTARCVIITTGTFLRGVLMIGHHRYSGGRHLRDSEEVEPPSVGLAHTLARFRFPLGRLKTGTPPRIDGRTIDWDVLEIQPSERPAVPFGHVRQFRGEQPPLVEKGTLIDCFKTATNEETHRLVMDYAHLLPKYDGLDGKGNGPRYCPSIYKKVERFPDRDWHNSFLEPEGLNTHIVYPNGMSGPYPEEIQLKIMRSMKGLQNVEIIRPGYDVEYDFVNPQCLTHTLETKSISGLYLAGQICGTTGYEEAAAQGIIAGANAGRSAKAAADSSLVIPKPFVIGRDEGYIGVLIDDLVTRGTTEPYRMFTSRAEYRISLRADNADFRLTRKAMEAGLIPEDDERIMALEAREEMVDHRIHELKNFKLRVTDWARLGGNDLMGGAAANRKGREGHKKSADEVLNMPHVTLYDVERIIRHVQSPPTKQKEQQLLDDAQPQTMTATPTTTTTTTTTHTMMEPSPPSIYDTVEASIKYKSYIRRQHKDMESWRRAQGVKIPSTVVYDRASLPTLSSEELEKLNLIRPSTFAEASKISGLTPHSLVYLYHHVARIYGKKSSK